MTGQALVFLRDGRVYEGHVTIDSAFVHFDGRRRVHASGSVTHRPAGGRTWPRRTISEIRWLEDASPEIGA